MKTEEAAHRLELVERRMDALAEEKSRLAQQIREIDRKLADIERDERPDWLRWHADAGLPRVPTLDDAPFVLDGRAGRRRVMVRARGDRRWVHLFIEGGGVACDGGGPCPEISRDTLLALLDGDEPPPIGEAPAPAPEPFIPEDLRVTEQVRKGFPAVFDYAGWVGSDGDHVLETHHEGTGDAFRLALYEEALFGPVRTFAETLEAGRAWLIERGYEVKR